MKILYVMLIGLLLIACQQGPSAEQLAKEKQLKDTSTKEVTNQKIRKKSSQNKEGTPQGTCTKRTCISI